MYTQNEKAELVDVVEEMSRSFLDYSMSVIISRALPDARDGLKPVHRRVLYAMRELGADPEAWRPHLVKRLGSLLHAELVTSSEVHFRKLKTPGGMRVLDIGWGADAHGGATS